MSRRGRRGASQWRRARVAASAWSAIAWYVSARRGYVSARRGYVVRSGSARAG